MPAVIFFACTTFANRKSIVACDIVAPDVTNRFDSSTVWKFPVAAAIFCATSSRSPRSPR